jgi:uncharacterized protein
LKRIRLRSEPAKLPRKEEDTMRLVGVEEHVNRASVTERMTYLPDALRAKLLPSVEQRIADMDAAGISVQVLSATITAPAPDAAANPLAPVMPLDESAVPMVQAVNEELYQMVSAHPDRFSAFATLPLGCPRRPRPSSSGRSRSSGSSER